MKIYFKKYLGEDRYGNLKPVPENYDVYLTDKFKKQFKGFKFNEEDVKDLIDSIKHSSPRSHLGHGVYKGDWWPKRLNMSKTEGRIIYILIEIKSAAWLMAIYEKNRQKDITESYKKELFKIADSLRGKK